MQDAVIRRLPTPPLGLLERPAIGPHVSQQGELPEQPLVAAVIEPACQIVRAKRKLRHGPRTSFPVTGDSRSDGYLVGCLTATAPQAGTSGAGNGLGSGRHRRTGTTPVLVSSRPSSKRVSCSGLRAR